MHTIKQIQVKASDNPHIITLDIKMGKNVILVALTISLHRQTKTRQLMTEKRPGKFFLVLVNLRPLQPQILCVVLLIIDWLVVQVCNVIHCQEAFTSQLHVAITGYISSPNWGFFCPSLPRLWFGVQGYRWILLLLPYPPWSSSCQVYMNFKRTVFGAQTLTFPTTPINTHKATMPHP